VVTVEVRIVAARSIGCDVDALDALEYM